MRIFGQQPAQCASLLVQKKFNLLLHLSVPGSGHMSQSGASLGCAESSFSSLSVSKLATISLEFHRPKPALDEVVAAGLPSGPYIRRLSCPRHCRFSMTFPGPCAAGQSVMPRARWRCQADADHTSPRQELGPQGRPHLAQAVHITCSPLPSASGGPWARR